ncbi:MAG: peptidoglycan DD-metalloendopeptidase family protein [Pyrinomonadaceae bacterium]|nr:peptidoglycan DD-metalloendopeptidase family protein [Pyrinomonadaceae bacterium]
MNVSALDNLIQTDSRVGKTSQSSDEAMRRTAQQFEAVLLMQLTSALNAASDEDDGEEKLFGGDGGTGLAKKMFSEQLATTMSESGGVGLANLIMEKFGNQTKPTGKTDGFLNAVAAVRDIQQNARTPTNLSKNVSADERTAPFAESRAKNLLPIGNPDEAEIVSRFSDEIAGDTDEEKRGYLTLDGQILNSTRARVVPDYVQAKNQSEMTTGNFPATPNPSEKVSFQMPVFGRISSDFGSRFHPIDRKTKFHGGIDIAVPKNTPIGAAADGIVKFAGWKDGYGNIVVIEHRDGSETFYGHNEKLLVAEGQPIRAGDVISLSGSTGKSTGPHLHFEVRVDGIAVNPHKFLSNVLPVRADR